jgi:hypothetical protein
VHVRNSAGERLCRRVRHQTANALFAISAPMSDRSRLEVFAASHSSREWSPYLDWAFSESVSGRAGHVRDTTVNCALKNILAVMTFDEFSPGHAKVSPHGVILH